MGRRPKFLKLLQGKTSNSRRTAEKGTAGWKETFMISGHAVSRNAEAMDMASSLEPHRLVIQATWTGHIRCCGQGSVRLSQLSKTDTAESSSWFPWKAAQQSGAIIRAGLSSLIFGFCLIPISAFGQGFRATIVGRVTDQSGAVVSKVKLIVTNVG